MMSRILSLSLCVTCLVLMCAVPSKGGGLYPWMAMESGVYDAAPPPLPRDLVSDLDSSGLTVNGSGVTISTSISSLRGSSSGWVNSGIAPSFGAKATTVYYDDLSAVPNEPDRNVANTNGWMLAKFEYTGPATTKTVSLALTGTTVRDAGVLNSSAHVGGGVDLFVPDAVFESSGPILSTDWEEILLYLGPFRQPPPAGAYVSIADPGGSNLNDAFSFPVTDGMTFYLGMTFAASAAYGVSDADALTTMQAAFTDPDGIELVIQEVVPTPSTVVLASAAVLMMLIRRRR